MGTRKMKTHSSLLICLHDDVRSHPLCLLRPERICRPKLCKGRTEAILVTMLTRKLLRISSIPCERLLQNGYVEHSTICLNPVFV